MGPWDQRRLGGHGTIDDSDRTIDDSDGTTGDSDGTTGDSDGTTGDSDGTRVRLSHLSVPRERWRPAQDRGRQRRGAGGSGQREG